MLIARIRRLALRPITARVGWTTLGYAGSQAVRFGTNLILTRLLAPELFGLMVLLTSLRVGLELFTDIGITQNVVANPNARDRDFYNTAWTIQLIRAVVLSLLPLGFIPFAETFYPGIDLPRILPYLSVMILVTGVHSIALPLSIKDLATARTAIYELTSGVVGAALIVGIVWVKPDIVGLLYGNIAAIAVATIFTFWLIPDLKLALRLDREHVGAIVGMGKWVFISSIAYFLATNFDRLVLAKYVPLASLGVYGIARALADIFGQFGSKLGNAIIFPGVASADVEGAALRQRIARHRTLLLLIAAAITALLIASADLVIGLLYDARYKEAAAVLPVSALAVWIGLHSTIAESILLGLRHARFLAAGNCAKFVVLAAALPIGVVHAGIVGAAWATVLAEVARYLVLSFGEARQGIGFKVQDAVLTTAMLAAASILHLALLGLGLASPWLSTSF